jgi:hypothetical protein
MVAINTLAILLFSSLALASPLVKTVKDSDTLDLKKTDIGSTKSFSATKDQSSESTQQNKCGAENMKITCCNTVTGDQKANGFFTLLGEVAVGLQCSNVMPAVGALGAAVQNLKDSKCSVGGTYCCQSQNSNTQTGLINVNMPIGVQCNPVNVLS